MSALKMLPEDVSYRIESKDQTLRADLLVIPAAEEDGWVATFEKGSWHNPASFSRENTMVWLCAQGWRRAELKNGKYCMHETFSGDLDGVRAALDLWS